MFEMILNIIFSLTGIYVFLFLFWRKLKEDYSQNQIFTVGFYSIIGFAALNLLSQGYAPKWIFWLSSLGSVTALRLIRVKVLNHQSLQNLLGSVLKHEFPQSLLVGPVMLVSVVFSLSAERV